MTESNQGPATPGTAARCEVCERPFVNAYLYPHGHPEFCGPENENTSCLGIAIERLKAENASLLDFLAVVTRERDHAQQVEVPAAYEALAAAEQRAEAAEKRSTELEEALRSAIGLSERLVREHGASAKENQAPRCGCAMCETARDLIILGKQLLKYRAALHDEERSAPPQEGEK